VRSPLLLLLVALACPWSVACSDRGDETGPRAERAFLEASQGEWVGLLRESATLEERVIRESPMRLIIHEGEAPRVEYPTLRCRGELRTPPAGTPQSTPTVGRFELVVEAPGLSPCLSGLVRITRKDEGLEYVFLGDSLRQVHAALMPQP
jgi:hypothetical protein